MKNIINNLKAMFTSNKQPKAAFTCNYANNYYGDQYCQANHKLKTK
ncbi:hypothetical protein [Thalassotalea agariperforans]